MCDSDRRKIFAVSTFVVGVMIILLRQGGNHTAKSGSTADS
jgi:hypothetical protein